MAIGESYYDRGAKAAISLEHPSPGPRIVSKFDHQSPFSLVRRGWGLGMRLYWCVNFNWCSCVKNHTAGMISLLA